MIGWFKSFIEIRELAKLDERLSSYERKTINQLSNQGLVQFLSIILLGFVSLVAIFAEDSQVQKGASISLAMMVFPFFRLFKLVPFSKAYIYATSQQKESDGSKKYEDLRNRAVRYYDSIYRKANYLPVDGAYTRDQDARYQGREYSNRNSMGDDFLYNARMAKRIVGPMQRKSDYKKAKKLDMFVRICDQKYNKA